MRDKSGALRPNKSIPLKMGLDSSRAVRKSRSGGPPDRTSETKRNLLNSQPSIADPIDDYMQIALGGVGGPNPPQETGCFPGQRIEDFRS